MNLIKLKENFYYQLFLGILSIIAGVLVAYNPENVPSLIIRCFGLVFLLEGFDYLFKAYENYKGE